MSLENKKVVAETLSVSIPQAVGTIAIGLVEDYEYFDGSAVSIPQAVGTIAILNPLNFADLPFVVSIPQAVGTIAIPY